LIALAWRYAKPISAMALALVAANGYGSGTPDMSRREAAQRRA
jgi:hypothetical protein